MTALILVVDDVPANVKLLEAKLTNEYYDVISAKNGYEALEQARKHKPDLILLDVMMPGMDGFEACRKMKEDVTISHIPVVMVTALSDPSDRVNGLEAGADDFITKPINDAALFARVRSLIRIKVLLDELRLRDKTGQDMGVITENTNTFISDVSGSHILLIDDDVVQVRRISETLKPSYDITVIEEPESVKPWLEGHAETVDLVIVSTQLAEMDGLRLAAQLKNLDAIRHVPIIVLVDEDDTELMLKGLELGVNDYLILPIDPNEMTARIKTQIRRKKYQEALKANYQTSLSMAITDQLTGLYNRHYLDAHMENVVGQAMENQKPLALLALDMDHFKEVNDTYGHDVGDEILQQLARIIVKSVRSSDLAARIGGEEFVVLMPETDAYAAYDTAERIRRTVAEHQFSVNHEVGVIHKTISIGMASLKLSGDNAVSLIKRSDTALYEAKHNGRNRVMPRPNHPQMANAAATAQPQQPQTLQQVMQSAAAAQAAQPEASPDPTPQPQESSVIPMPAASPAPRQEAIDEGETEEQEETKPYVPPVDTGF